MHALHLSTALGAFIAGVMLADSPYRHEIEADVEPFRSILLGLFFLAVGMVLDLHAVAANPLFVLSMAAILVLTKAAIITGLARLFGMARSEEHTSELQSLMRISSAVFCLQKKT